MDWSLCQLQVYAPNATSEYQAFVDEVNDALLRVSPTESSVLTGDFVAHVGTDLDTWKGVIGKHEVTGLNEKGEYFLQFCSSNSSNGLPIMNTFFQHREAHKYIWYRPEVYAGFSKGRSGNLRIMKTKRKIFPLRIGTFFCPKLVEKHTQKKVFAQI